MKWKSGAVRLIIAVMLLSCQEGNNELSDNLKLPATPPLSAAGQWGVVLSAAAKLSGEPDSLAPIIALVPYYTTVLVKQLRLRAKGSWCLVMFADQQNQVHEGWLPESSILFLANKLEALQTGRRLKSNRRI